MSLSHLDVAKLPLSGRHLIEASAGTGKTFNITRIYLRFLLEKRLPVQQILVMTFTKAATEEIKGRIAATLRDALVFWRNTMRQGMDAHADPVMSSIYRTVPGDDGIALLQAALLELDDAAVFTIHSFCNRVLGDMAFTSGTPLELTLASDTRSLYRVACEDFFRKISQDEHGFLLLQQQNWHSPDKFIRRFGNLFDTDAIISYSDSTCIHQEYAQALARISEQHRAVANTLHKTLICSSGLVEDTLILNKPERQQEWDIILDWLAGDDFSTVPVEAGKFVHGNRFRAKRDGLKEVGTALAPLKAFRASLTECLKRHHAAREVQLKKAPVFEIVYQAIEFIRQRVKHHKSQQQHVDFNDLIRLLAERIDSPDSTLSQQLRTQYPVALVDEFQDTDANQYHILAQVYSENATNQHGHALLMIGDPKQAIYGFRGGDIFTYLRAAKQAKYRWVMDTNWRSVEPMVNAYNRLFWGNALTSERRDLFDFDIVYEPVKASVSAKAASLVLNDPDDRYAALTFLVLPQDSTDEERSPPNKAETRSQQAQMLSREIVRLINRVSLGSRKVQPSDIAILVKDGNEARIIQHAMTQYALPSVYLSNRNSLFESAEAADLLRLLDAIWHLQDLRLVQSALVSPLLGLPTADVHALLQDDEGAAWDTLLTQMNRWRDIWQTQGVLSLILLLLQQQAEPTISGAERCLTNYQHLAEVVQQAAKDYPQPAHQLNWLRRQVFDPQQAQEQVQRLESDAMLIQIVTQHGSKGLEYPIVFIPFASEYRDSTRKGNSTLDAVRYYDERMAKQQVRLGPGPAVLERVKREADAESMRLLYVAITRASHRCYLGVADSSQSELSPLGKILAQAQYHDWQAAIAVLVGEGNGHTASITHIDNDESRQLNPEAANLHCQSFTRELSDPWRLHSFTALTKQVAHTRYRQRESETDDIAHQSTMPQVSEQHTPLRYSLTPGAQSGNLLHDLLETVDFAAPDWWGTGVEIAQRYGINEHDYSALFGWLDEVLLTPLIDDYDGRCFNLQALTIETTLREAEFYFPLQATSRQALSKALFKHRQTLSDNPSIVHIEGAALAGMMHGFIDLIFKHGDRYYVADYKSTFLGDDERYYTPTHLSANNMQHNYDLQYLIYCVALHRFLARRIDGYDPSIHLGGVYYFYLRGMSPDHRANTGVFFKRIPVDMMLAVEKALTGKAIYGATGSQGAS